MLALFVQVCEYLLFLLLLWVGTGFIVSTMGKYAHHLRTSSFVLSFFLLGLLTSIPEMAVGVTSLIAKKPDVFVGNLLGGIPIIFLLIIPLVAILGNGIFLKHDLRTTHIVLICMIIALPSLLFFDGALTVVEAILAFCAYMFLFLVMHPHVLPYTGIPQSSSHRQQGFFNILLLKILLGIALVLISSHFLVNQTLQFAQVFGIAPFLMSVFALSLGTNMPEIAIAIRSIVAGKKEVAFGDYLGSAAANTLLFGIFTPFSGTLAFGGNMLFITCVFTLVGLGVFLFLSKKGKVITRIEGVCLLALYLLFLGCELFFVHPT